MGYNGREFPEPYTMSNGAEDLIGSMSNLHVGDQTTSGSSNAPLSLGRTNLNPNAAEFVPMAYKPPEQEPKPSAGGESGSRLNRTNSINSNASDDEYRKLCRAQLPDDLMPDFDFGDFVENTEYEEQPAPSTPNWTGNVEQFTYDQRASAYSPRFEGSTSSGVPRPYMPELRSPVQQQQQQQQQVNRAWNDNSETGTSFTEWGSSDLAFPEDLTESVDPITILATEFPGFASESLAEIYYANAGDLALTVDMLTELELQNEGASAKQFQAPPAPAPPSPRDFPALAGLDVSGRTESRAVPDFAAAVRKQAAAQQAAQLQFERNGGVDLSLGAVRGLSQGPGFSREARVAHNERLEPFHVHEVQAPVAWLETGDSVSNMYAEMREEARDHARVRNAYFDQARQAYLTGNKSLAKELSAKGQWHNEQMKVAHNKAGEAIYWQRNSNAYANSAPGQRLIDLHGLHVGEAIPLLKREIAQIRYNVRNSRQREIVFICVGTGHHTKGSRTPSRLPAAVQRYLLEEEHLQFTEPQAGMLRIVIR